MNPVVHFEIPADDVKRARDFYSRVFGWGFQEVPQMDYHMVTTTPPGEDGLPATPGAINGGLMSRSVPGEQPVLVVGVDDVVQHLKRVQDAGGKVVLDAAKVGDQGIYARVLDVEGNVVGLWQKL